MTTNYLKISVLAVTVLLTLSCKKFLDVKPVGKLIPSKVEELENLLNNNGTIDFHFINGNRGSFYPFLGDNYVISENQAKYLYISTHPNVDIYAAHTFNQPYENPRVPQFAWNSGIYLAVGLFNNVIDGVKSLNATESATGKLITAQAKAGRAWSLMVGTLTYGPMFNPNGQNNTKVLPYRTSADPGVANPDLSTTAEALALVEQDLKDALGGAPANVSNPSRANLAATHALLAQLYMYKRDWVKMHEHAQEAWTRSIAVKGSVDNLIYNYNSFAYKPNPSANPAPGTDVEVTLSLEAPDLLQGQVVHRENLFYRMVSNGTPYPSQDYLDLFDKTNDRRYKLFSLKALGYSVTVGGIKYDDGIRTLWYRDRKMNSSQGLTYPDLLLMQAEAAARLNDLSTALSDLNTLRKYRYSGAVTNLPGGVGLSQDALLFEILKERRREQPIGSFHRVLDIKRYVYDTGKPWSKTSITHTIGSKVYTSDIEGPNFRLQIANQVLAANPQWGLPLFQGVWAPTSK
ncbi:RagB/SusD family nutrient uptake outer membrane protein [Pedobacter deserti]|uniref:RagB/SusD family nutrient uptake outer membrane protein n=1 Tax=Pedobacter deserti TaxID=2817382 RepID=UPI00210C80F3|nr:RagB/SusD family nutrient uptake outer membrane protein [Pedobacter sp. SYSU D00382]